MSTHDVPNIYHVPLMLQEQGLCDILGVDCSATGMLDEWKAMAYHLDTLTEEVHIAMVGSTPTSPTLTFPSSRACSTPPWLWTENLSSIGLRPATSKMAGTAKSTTRRGRRFVKRTASWFPAGLATAA